MLRSRTFRFGVAALAAAGSGVGVALAAAPGEQQPTFGITIASREGTDYRIGKVGQSANVRPTGGEIDQDGSGAFFPLEINCPVDQVSDCEMLAPLDYDKLPDGETSADFTATSVVTSTVIDAGTTTTSTATIPARVFGQAQPTVDVPEPVDFGEVPVGGTSSPRTVTVTNDADADHPLTFEQLGFGESGDQFALADTTCEVIAPGDECTVSLVFRPTRTGRTETYSELRFVRSAGNPEVEVVATATPAVPTPTVTQTQTVTAPGTPPPAVTVTTPGPTVTVRVPAPAAQCVVPDLKGRSQTSARRALEKASCALGTVRKPKGGGSLVVASQTVRAGTRRTAGTKVGIRLAPKARTARRR